MTRWLLLGLCIAASACKVVTSTGEGDGDAGVTGRPVLGFATTNVPAYESNGEAFVEITMSRPSADPIMLSYMTSDGTAIQGADYQAQHDTVIIDPGSTAYPIYIPIIADTLEENDETFTVIITSVSGATIGRGATQVTITSNHEPTLSFSIASQAQPEGFPGSIGLTLSEPSSVPVVVSYVLDGTATPNVDYYVQDAPAGPLAVPYQPGAYTIAPGQVYGYLPISPYNDDLDEPDETILATLISVTNAKIGSQFQHSYTIKDDDFPPTVTFLYTTTSYYEGTGSNTTASITVQMSAPSNAPVTVPFTIDAASTAAADDYTLLSTSPLTFQPGQTQVSIDISLIGDSTVEGLESLTLHLGTPTNASLGFYTTTQLLILNDDCIGTGSFAVCPDAALAGDVVLPPDLDTDSSSLCAYSSGWELDLSNACVVFARSISVSSTVVHGWRPLIVAATQTIDVATSLDVSPQQGATYVPGVGWANCTGTSGGTRSGGAGGSFMTVGGAGGSHTNPTGTGGSAGASVSAPTFLRSGCTGQLGGDNTLATSGGRGGGAISLLANGSITVHPGAFINASGEPGRGSTDLYAGGSGGGSGGMLVFSAPSFTVSGAFILANGAGGAEGGSGSQGGTTGSAPNPLAPLTPAPGGSGTQGGNGGNGFAQGIPATAGTSTNNNNGGGGGGGGAGYIHTNMPLTGATVSPAPS